ncbi:unnamed protein product [Mycena citricolor]|uniref:CNNM transmembrane domain-containing protein n=1 Tax=Mycena citricolor TaxID=2018698 RepID=A0AAD2JWN7_9AGAR|nr:unnamed protein product [Mycena citricolor]
MTLVPGLSKQSTRLVYSLYSVASQYVTHLLPITQYGVSNASQAGGSLFKREKFDPHKPTSIVFAVLIPVLVLASGVFAGLTLGYMSLDETQLNVLSISGTPKQREYANKIKPIRKNGHLLLVTLLLANMITNETLPIVADPVLGGGVQSVVVSTVLIVIFAEIIPQSLFTRHGLFLGAKMAGFTRVLIYGLGIVAWPVAKLLELILGSHHGIIYRRAELKELIAMHDSGATHGGDLRTDTVTIIGATLDLQEKVVRQAMTPIADVFMLSIDSYLDYDLLKKICLTGHSRVPVYEEIELNGTKVKKIIGILLVKHCVLLDPKDAIPLRKIPLNKVPFIPHNEPLLRLLDKFQEGRSHMAIVSRFGEDKAASVKKAVKRGLTQRLRERVGMGDSSDEEEEKEKEKDSAVKKKFRDIEEGIEEESSEGDETLKSYYASARGRSQRVTATAVPEERERSRRASFQLPSRSGLEQSMPADAVLGKEGVAEFLQNFDPAVMPLGIITLEDVLEELIGEEIYDEFDPQGAHGDPYVPPGEEVTVPVTIEVIPVAPNVSLKAPTPVLSLKGLNFLRSRSAPPTPRDTVAPNLPLHAAGSLAIKEHLSSEDLTAPGGGGGPVVVVVGRDSSPSPTPTMPEEAEDAAVKKNVLNGISRSASASPVPSMAILLERKRRLGTGTPAGTPGGGIVSPIPVPALIAPKVSRLGFKSSPLGGGERAAGLVVAEQVKEQSANSDLNAGIDAEQIPNEKDKEGPDK